jgi:hypothetical protein
LPGGISVYLSRIGPGAFFALFGACLVGFSFHSTVEASRMDPALETTQTAEQRRGDWSSYKGAAGHTVMDTATLSAQRAAARTAIHNLNQVALNLPTSWTPGRVSEMRATIRKARLAIVAEVWGQDWEDFGAFRLWVDAGENDPVPAAFTEPATMLHHGEPSTL